jgi:hypothetical protein
MLYGEVGGELSVALPHQLVAEFSSSFALSEISTAPGVRLYALLLSFPISMEGSPARHTPRSYAFSQDVAHAVPCSQSTWAPVVIHLLPANSTSGCFLCIGIGIYLRDIALLTRWYPNIVWNEARWASRSPVS